MKPTREGCAQGSCDYWMVSAAAGKLENQASTLGVKHIKEAYQALAQSLGNKESEGNLAYSSVDLGLSAYGLSRYILKPDAWRLFRYIKTDYIRSYKGMGIGAWGLEIHTDFQTGKQIYQEADK